VATITIKSYPALWCTVITKEHHPGVVAFRGVCKQINGSVVVKQEIVWSSGLRANDIRSLNRISGKEDWLAFYQISSTKDHEDLQN
jgi:hypothetical protein